MVICYETDSSKVKLLGIHVYFEFELGSKFYLLDLKNSNATFFCQVSIVLTLHLGLFFITSELIVFVTIQMVLDSLGHDFFDLSFTLRWVGNRLLSHNSEVVGHRDPGFRSRHETQ